MKKSGHIRKLVTSLDDPVQYRLPIGDELVVMNPLIGQNIRLQYSGDINCIACGRKTGKSFNQGYCYPCFKRLPECDSCIIKPELCHYAQGTCRDASWGEQHCLREHYVYLANSSGIKVGITRGSQIPTRWMDQGATQALPIIRVANRLQSGLVEVIIKQHVADKTHWQRMLKGTPEKVDLIARRDELLEVCRTELQNIIAEQGENSLVFLQQDVVTINYPVDEYPLKVKSFNFDKTAEVSGKLLGIKGQYLILDSGVINMRKFAGYHVDLHY